MPSADLSCLTALIELSSSANRKAQGGKTNTQSVETVSINKKGLKQCVTLHSKKQSLLSHYHTNCYLKRIAFAGEHSSTGFIFISYAAK